MHYYSFHIGDYKSHTHHLTLMEDLAFRRLLDHYYLHQAPIKQRDIARQIGMRDQEQDVLTVLNEFFVSTEDGFINPRADKEIAAYCLMAEAGKRGAEKRWKKGGDSHPIATPLPPLTPPNSNHEPITKNHKPITNTGRDARATRLPDQDLPDAWRDFCQTERPDLVPDQTYAKFRDYWTAKPGKAGTKLDWLATWRNWVREEKRKAGEPAWRTEQRKRTLEAVPSIAQGGSSQVVQFFDVEAKNVTAIALG